MTRTPEPRTAVVWPRSFRSQISAVEICAKVKNSSAEAKGLFSQSSMGFVQCEAPGHDSVQLVNITPITMVYGTYNELVTGAYKPTYNWGTSHCRDLQLFIEV